MRKNLLALFLLLIGQAHAQLEHFTKENGLPSDRVYDITIDNKGFLWIATDLGVAYYNGKEFKIFNTSNGLPINDIYKIIPTSDGKLWFFGKTSRPGYIENGRIFAFNSSNNSILNPVGFIIHGEKMGIFFSSSTYYLQNREWNDKSLKDIPDSLVRYYQFFFNPLFNRNIIYNGNYLIEVDNSFHAIKKLQVDNKVEWTIQYWNIAVFYNDFFYLLTNKKLFKYNFIDKNCSVFESSLFHVSDLFTSHFCFNNGRIGISNSKGRFDISGDSIRTEMLLDTSIFKEDIIGNYNDIGGNLWANTFTGGLYRLPVHAHTPRLFNNQIVQKIEVLNNTLYAAVEGKGLYLINPGNNSNEKIFDSTTFFYKVRAYNNRYIHVFTNHHHFLFNDDENIPIRAKYINGLFINGGKDAYISGDTVTWVTSYFLMTTNFKEEVFLMLMNVGNYSIENYHSRLFLGSNNGLRFFDGNKIHNIYTFPPVPIKKLLTWNDYLIFGTDGYGLYFGNEKSIRHVGILGHTVVNDIWAEDDKNLWIATNLGAHRATLTSDNSVKVLSILQSNGLISNHVNDIRVHKRMIYFATDKGLCWLDKDSINTTKHIGITPLYFELNDSIYNPDSKSIIANGKNVNKMSFRYDIGFLGEHEQLRTYYKLEPIMGDWEETDFRELNFNGLKPDNYSLRIRVESLNNGSSEIMIGFTVKSRWYELGYVRALIFILFLIVLIAVSIVISRYIIKRNKRRYQLQKKMVDIELDALRSKLDPHFIFNILNSLQLQINLNDTDSSEKLLLLFSNHIRNAFDYSHKKSITLDQEINFIREYLSLETIRFKDRIKWEIRIDPKLDIDSCIIPSMLLQPYVENAIKHGFRDKIKEAVLNIEFIYLDKNSYMVYIIDNGRGISTDSSERRSSTGLLSERIELLNQSGDWEIIKTVSNLYPTEKDKGTVITLKFTMLIQ